MGIKDNNREMVATALSKLLADEMVLTTKTRNAHWNVEGPDFLAKHHLFESQFTEIDGIVDAVAERIRSIGHYAPATLKEYLELTQIAEQPNKKNYSKSFMKSLLMDQECIVLTLRESIQQFTEEYHDYGSSDFVTGIMELHEKMAWMLRAHLKTQ